MHWSRTLQQETAARGKASSATLGHSPSNSWWSMQTSRRVDESHDCKGCICWKTSIGKQVGPRIQRQKELNITINNWILWKIVERALNCKSIYKGNWPPYIGKSHTNECHHSAGPDRHLRTDLVATLKFSLHCYRPHRGGQNLNSQQ